jgi:hypothetical protein
VPSIVLLLFSPRRNSRSLRRVVCDHAGVAFNALVRTERWCPSPVGASRCNASILPSDGPRSGGPDGRFTDDAGSRSRCGRRRAIAIRDAREEELSPGAAHEIGHRRSPRGRALVGTHRPTPLHFDTSTRSVEPG